MLATIRSMKKFFEKEETAPYWYNRAQPHFKWFLALTATLSVALVFGGYTAVSQASENIRHDQLGHHGAVALSETMFVDQVISDGAHAYWLGPILYHEFAIDFKVGGEKVVTYLVKGMDIYDPNQRKLIIDTYQNFAGGDSAAHSRSWTNVTKEVTARGVVFEFDKDSMEEERVQIKGTTSMVFIHYPRVQTLQSMRDNADTLKLVS